MPTKEAVERFEALSREWEGIEYALGGGCLTPEQSKKAHDRQLEIEREQDATGLSFDDNDEVVELPI